MSDLEQLFWVLVALYAWMSAVWLRPGGVLIVSHFGERHRPRSGAGSALLHNDRGGVLFANLTPLGNAIVAHPWPAVIAPQGILSFCPASCTADAYEDVGGRFVAWDDVGKISREGKCVRINGEDFVNCVSAMAARRWQALIEQVQGESPAGRAKTIGNAVASSLDASAAAAAHAQIRGGTRLLRAASLCLVLYAFGVLAVAAFSEVKPDFLSAVAGYFALLFIVFTIDFFTQRQLLPREVRRGGHAWMLLISPADAIRAADDYYRHRLEAFHPLALEMALGTKDAARELAERTLADLRHPLAWQAPDNRTDAREAGNWFRSLLQEQIEASLSAAGYVVSELFPPIVPDGPENRAYCPRCRGQYEIARGSCSTCRLPLVEFALSVRQERSALEQTDGAAQWAEQSS